MLINYVFWPEWNCSTHYSRATEVCQSRESIEYWNKMGRFHQPVSLWMGQFPWMAVAMCLVSNLSEDAALGNCPLLETLWLWGLRSSKWTSLVLCQHTPKPVRAAWCGDHGERLICQHDDAGAPAPWTGKWLEDRWMDRWTDEWNSFYSGSRLCQQGNVCWCKCHALI